MTEYVFAKGNSVADFRRNISTEKAMKNVPIWCWQKLRRNSPAHAWNPLWNAYKIPTNAWGGGRGEFSGVLFFASNFSDPHGISRSVVRSF